MISQAQKIASPVTPPEGADVIALSTILGGLLASGHYSCPDDNTDDRIMHWFGLITTDFGPDWAEESPYDPSFRQRVMPKALMAAFTLLRWTREVILANKTHQ
jgi:hypothetical protein